MYTKLVEWSHQEFSHLPWRKNRSMFGTLVSEIMLQQTTVSTVLNHFERFLKEYPTPFDVMKASDEQLTISWKGLGYYRRARNLKKACEFICTHYEGELPLCYETLVGIPGIGAYTANAILSVGANQSVLALDANLERVIARLFAIPTEKGPKLLKEINRLFKSNSICQDVFKIGGRDYNEALMDLGRNYCQARRATCELCPLSDICLSFNQKIVSNIPSLSEKKKEQSYELNLLRLLIVDKDHIYMYQKSNKEWLSGQWEVPTYVLDCEDEKFKQYPEFNNQSFNATLLPSYKTLITKYKIKNYTMVASLSDVKSLGIDIAKYSLMPLDIKKQNFSTASIKAIKLLLS